MLKQANAIAQATHSTPFGDVSVYRNGHTYFTVKASTWSFFLRWLDADTVWLASPCCGRKLVGPNRDQEHHSCIQCRDELPGLYTHSLPAQLTQEERQEVILHWHSYFGGDPLKGALVVDLIEDWLEEAIARFTSEEWAYL